MYIDGLKKYRVGIAAWVLLFGWLFGQGYVILSSTSSAIVLKDLHEILPIIGFTALAQYVIAWFPVAIFVSFSIKREISKTIWILFPLIVVVGSEVSDILTSTVYETIKNIDSSLVKTILNSPQAALLVYMLPAFVYSMFAWRIKKIKAWAFMSITFMVFYSMNIIYHSGIIQGDMKYVVESVLKEQKKLTEITSNADEAKKYCDFKGWSCSLVEINKKDGAVRQININEYTLDKASSEVIVKKLKSSDAQSKKIFERNFSLRRDRTAFLSTAIKDREDAEGVVWFVMSDVKFFGEYFARADLHLSAMLASGNLLWIIIFLYLLKKHKLIIDSR